MFSPRFFLLTKKNGRQVQVPVKEADIGNRPETFVEYKGRVFRHHRTTFSDHEYDEVIFTVIGEPEDE